MKLLENLGSLPTAFSSVAAAAVASVNKNEEITASAVKDIIGEAAADVEGAVKEAEAAGERIAQHAEAIFQGGMQVLGHAIHATETATEDGGKKVLHIVVDSDAYHFLQRLGKEILSATDGEVRDAPAEVPAATAGDPAEEPKVDSPEPTEGGENGGEPVAGE